LPSPLQKVNDNTTPSDTQHLSLPDTWEFPADKKGNFTCENQHLGYIGATTVEND